MKNKIIALMAVIPLIIMFTIMTLTDSVAVSVAIPVSGVNINTPTENGVLTIDMAEYENDSYLQVEVLPLNAANRGYTLSFSAVDGTGETGEIAVEEDGLIRPLDTGAVRVTATTNDGGYRASIIVNVVSTKAIGAEISVFNFDVPSETYEVRPSSLEGIDYEVSLPGGRFVFSAAAYPSSVTADVAFAAEPYAGSESGGFSIHSVTGLAYVRLSGEYLLTVTLNPAVAGRERVTVLVRADCGGEFTVQGRAEDAEIRVVPGSDSAVFYAESQSEIEVAGALPQGVSDVGITSLGGGRVSVTALFGRDFADEDEAVITLVSDGVERRVTFVFAESVSELFSRYVDAETDEFLQKTGTQSTYAAVTEPSVPDGTSFRFELEGNAARIESFDAAEGTCTVTALAEGVVTLRLYVVRDGEEREADVRYIRIVNGYSSFVFSENAATWGIGGVYAAGGLSYADGGYVREDILLGLQTVYGTTTSSVLAGDIECSVSDPSLAQVYERDGKAYLRPTGTGRVTVTASWEHTDVFNDNITASLTVDCVADGVNVGDYTSLAAATEAGYAVVLTADIMLGENQFGEDGFLRPGADLTKYVKQLETTADWTYYANRGLEHPTVNYVIEFKNDVYGNGKFIDADYITQVTPSVSSSVSVFKGPLDFVAIQGTAAVKAQDNIVFLVRTDGVVIDNVVLRGCSDDSLYEDGQMNLSLLNTTGTVLELMADCRVINSRIMNGRTGVRAFGRYGIDPVTSDSNPVDAEAERIDVSLESCIVSTAREFLVKLGTNRKVRGEFTQEGMSSSEYDIEAMEPSLSANGVTYAPRNDANLSDANFEDNFVLTHLTLENCALYNSGLFAIGFESCFAGPMLDGGAIAPDYWTDIGGTSYSAVLKLVGDVRIYDWKSLATVDSSTLIELPGGASGNTAFLQLNIREMLNKVKNYGGDAYSDLIYTADGGEYVHGGIAMYGGGKNYGIVDFSEFGGEMPTEYSINLSILAQGEDNMSNLYLQGTMLPLAAGTQDFRFFMYDASSEFGYQKQIEDIASGTAFDFIVAAER